MNIDLAVYVDGYHGDCSAMFCVGEVDEAGRQLIETTKECLYRAIEVCGPNVPFTAIGDAIEPIAKRKGFSVVRDFAGHGIGKQLHEQPFIYHFQNDEVAQVMLPGMTFTIEPMINEGHYAVMIWKDQWTVATQDHSRSAQFEHTLLITEHGCDLLT
jgi:methionyl aminopeptidase